MYNVVHTVCMYVTCMYIGKVDGHARFTQTIKPSLLLVIVARFTV